VSRNVIETLMGAVVLLVAAFFLIFAYTAANVGAVEGYRVSARFDDIGGLTPGSDVTISGVRVGSVVGTTVDPDTFQAVVTMTIDRAIRLDEFTSATVTSSGLLGGNHISLQPGGGEMMIEPGGSIEYTQSTPGLEQLLGQVIYSISDLGEGGSGGNGDGQGGSGLEGLGSGLGGGSQGGGGN
jgi:phospholipid/cholesterol/gamma-HCH transport system substrate-binding protein